MNSNELENLARTGQLKRTPPDDREVEALIRSGSARLADARNRSLAIESRFDLAYNAVHALALAALRRKGYRSENRYVVFQVLPQTLGMPASVWRVLAKCHGLRNAAEYEGGVELDTRLVDELIAAVTKVQSALG